MNNNRSVMKWSQMHTMPVIIPIEGITVGTVEDFYFKPDTNSVYALHIRIRIGERILPVTGISTVEPDRITIPNAQMLLERVPPLPTGQNLLTAKIISESNKELGTIKEILIGVEPPVAMRLAGFEIVDSSGRRQRTQLLPADGVFTYRQDTVVITDMAAKGLR